MSEWPDGWTPWKARAESQERRRAALSKWSDRAISVAIVAILGAWFMACASLLGLMVVIAYRIVFP